MIESTAVSRLDRSVPTLDAWRRDPRDPPTHGQVHKEWLHFSIHAGSAHVLFNVSAMERPAAPDAFTTWRTALLVHTARGWAGAVRNVPARAVAREGPVGVRTPDGSIGYSRGAYHLRAELGGARLDARVRPLVLPTSPSSVSLVRDHAMHWVVVPRGLADGKIVVDEQAFSFCDASTYHDHNWGRFAWGSDLTWDWGHILPEDPSDPWVVVFVRVSSGDRTRALSQGVLVWRRDVNVRTFENREIRFASSGVFRETRMRTFPHLCGLLAPGTASGIPARLDLEASGRVDGLSIHYEPEAACRVAIPADRHPTQITLLNETVGRARVDGLIGADRVAFEAPAIVEFVRAQSS